MRWRRAFQLPLPFGSGDGIWFPSVEVEIATNLVGELSLKFRNSGGQVSIPPAFAGEHGYGFAVKRVGALKCFADSDDAELAELR